MREEGEKRAEKRLKENKEGRSKKEEEQVRGEGRSKKRIDEKGEKKREGTERRKIRE